MVIRRLAIRNFGKIHNTTLDFAPGINVLYGENESGKTTVHTYIKSMLYGMHRGRGRASRKDSYSKYEPWENPADYGGSLWFEEGGKNFRLTRSFAKEYASEELYCEDDGEMLDIAEGDLDMLLGNISETVYENTVSVAQLKSVTGRDLVMELQNYMASYQGTGDLSVDLGRTAQMLKMTRKGYQVQEDRAMKKREEEIHKIRANRDYVLQELDDLKSRADARNQQLLEEDLLGVNEKKSLQGQEKIFRSKADQMQRYMILTAIATLLIGLGGLVIRPAYYAIWLIVLLLGGIGIYFENQKKLFLEASIIKSQRKVQRLQKFKDRRSWDRKGMEEKILEKETNLRNLQLELKEYEQNSMKLSYAQKEIDAINLAMDTMECLTTNFRYQIGTKLRMRTAEILREITDGKYENVLIDSDFHISVNTENRLVPIENLSRGTLEQIYFSLRMAAAEILCKDEKLPVILDDVFGMYDEDRLTAVLHWLEREPRQVIISTCNRREVEILQREGITFHEVNVVAE